MLITICRSVNAMNAFRKTCISMWTRIILNKRDSRIKHYPVICDFNVSDRPHNKVILLHNITNAARAGFLSSWLNDSIFCVGLPLPRLYERNKKTLDYAWGMISAELMLTCSILGEFQRQTATWKQKNNLARSFSYSSRPFKHFFHPWSSYLKFYDYLWFCVIILYINLSRGNFLKYNFLCYLTTDFKHTLCALSLQDIKKTNTWSFARFAHFPEP